MTDRELLELAARAAGLSFEFCRPEIGGCLINDNDGSEWWFDPLTSDGDALRLAVKLRLEVAIHETYSGVFDGNLICGHVQHGDDPYAATRRAIVRAAAEIGKGMI